MIRVLFVGQDPKTVDFSDPSLPPGFNAEKIQAGIDVAAEKMKERGWAGDLCMIAPDDAGIAVLEKQLQARRTTASSSVAECDCRRKASCSSSEWSTRFTRPLRAPRSPSTRIRKTLRKPQRAGCRRHNGADAPGGAQDGLSRIRRCRNRSTATLRDVTDERCDVHFCRLDCVALFTDRVGDVAKIVLACQNRRGAVYATQVLSQQVGFKHAVDDIERVVLPVGDHSQLIRRRMPVRSSSVCGGSGKRFSSASNSWTSAKLCAR